MGLFDNYERSSCRKNHYHGPITWNWSHNRACRISSSRKYVIPSFEPERTLTPSRAGSIDTQPKAMILIAPFSSITSLFETFKVASVVPILGPFATIPFAIQTFLKVLYTRFDTLSIIHTITSCPILIVHALNDRTIPTSVSHSLIVLKGDFK